MPDILIPPAYRRENGNFPEFRLINMFFEQTPTNERGSALLSRPPLVEDAVIGSGPIYGQFRQDGTFDGDTFTVSGGDLYRGSTLIGTIDGTGPVKWAASYGEVVVTRGASAWSYNGTNLAAIGFPDGLNVNAVEYISGLFFFTPESTPASPPGRFYWSSVNDARTINALDFANAESEPDQLSDFIAVGDNAYMLGTVSIEVWVLTGDPDAPLSRISQRNYANGVIGTGCALEADNAIHMIGNDCIVYRLAEVAQRVSDHGLEERIQASLQRSMFKFKWQGHLFICIRLDTGTWGLDLATNQWSEFATYGRDTWAPACAINIDAQPQFGDDATGTVWTFGEFDEDDCGTAFQRIFPAAFPIAGNPAPVFNILIDHNAGAATKDEGQGSDPALEMRYSRDGGRTFGTWRSTRLGRKGDYRRMARFGSCGQFESPGALFEFRLSDPCPLRISRVRVNEGLSGRSRV